jgi:serine/threonine protein kinase
VLKPGTSIGPYEVLSPVGTGGMGEVHRARDTRLRRDVALKTLPDALAQRPDRLARLRREALILASLNHPGIATLHGIEENDAGPVLVMELLSGETLASRLHRGPLSLKEALHTGRQVAEAMAAAHEKGVLHRDLKPANIQLGADGRAKVLDFGLARAMEGDLANSALSTATSSPDRSGPILGTAPYMSPEQARGEAVDERTDVWAFGCVLFEMLTGKRAFPGHTFAQTVAGILYREPDWAAVPDSAPPPLQRLLRRCLRKDTTERLRALADAALELAELEQEISAGSGPGGRMAPTGRRPSRLRLGVAAVVVH